MHYKSRLAAMEKMSSGHVEFIGILLVKEYLTAKRLVSTLRCMELESPLKIRHSNMRLLLSRIFNVDDAKSCAESLNSYQSMLEIIMRDFMSNKANYTYVECSLQQFESDECRVPKSVTPDLKTFQISNTRCESPKMRSSTSLEDILESRTRSSSLKITRETTVNFKKNYDFQNVKKLMNFVAIQGKSKYMTRDEESVTCDGNPMQGYGADQPRDYPKQHLQSCLREREEILMSSLRRSPDYLNTDNSIRLGPNKVNTFQCLKTNLEPQSGTDETAKKYERFSRIIPKISKRLSDSSLGTTKTLQDSDKAKDVPCESSKNNRSPVEEARSSTPTYSEQKTASCNASSQEQKRFDMVNSENKCVSISKECTNTHVSNKEDTKVLSDNDEKNMNVYESESVRSENSESINLTDSNESDTIRIPLDGNLNLCKETNNENPGKAKHTRDIEEESLENSICSLEIENADKENKECELPNSSEENKGSNFFIIDYEDTVNEQVESLTFQPMSTKLSNRLTKLFSGNECSIDVPSRWKGQSFVFNDSTKLKFGLMQAQGGPCGVIAVVQAFLLKALLFDDKTQAVCQDPFRPTQMELRTGLVQAISEILWQAGKGERAVLALYESTGNEDDDDDEEEEEDGEVRENEEKQEKTIICRKFNKLQDLQSTIKQELNQFLSTDGNGCYLVAISAILSSGIESVLSDMDEASNSLIVNGGSCSLELVNLLLTGNAVSNVFDNNMHIGPCLLKGVSKRSNIGFLSIYEHTNTCQVGSNLKTPRYPIWVVNCQNHFTVIYSENKKLISDWRAERQFNIYLYDSMNHQKDEVKLTIDTTGLYLKPRSDGEYVPPIELCLLTKWKGAAISWNGNKYM